MNNSNRKFIIIITLFVIVTFIYTSNISRESKKEFINSSMSNENMKPISNESIKIDIKGSVYNAGIYELDKESRLNDLIINAGGFNNANEDCYNLAQKLNDGTQVIIKSKDEECENSKLININTADSDELIRINGIGPGRATSILEYRDQNGVFNSLDDLKNVSGIGEATFNKMKGQITLWSI